MREAMAVGGTASLNWNTLRRYGSKNIQRLALLACIAATLLGFAMFQSRIVSIDNLRNLSVQASYLALFASAQAIVILTRGFDLSVGTTVSLVSVLCAMAMTLEPDMGVASVALGALVALGVGVLVGAVNGALVAWGGVNPFVATLGVTSILATLAATVSDGFPVTGLPEVSAVFDQARFLGAPLSGWVVATVLILVHLLLSRTVVGRYLYLVGSNPRTARLAGIPVKATLMAAYILCSVLMAVGAVLLTARTGSGEPNLGGNLALETIAAAVLGGMRLSGGEGDISAPLLGALFITILSNGMNLLQFDGFIQQICLGVVIIASLAIDKVRRS